MNRSLYVSLFKGLTTDRAHVQTGVSAKQGTGNKDPDPYVTCSTCLHDKILAPAAQSDVGFLKSDVEFKQVGYRMLDKFWSRMSAVPYKLPYKNEYYYALYQKSSFGGLSINVNNIRYFGQHWIYRNCETENDITLWN